MYGATIRVIINLDLYEVVCEGMDWIDLAQDKNRWRALVTAVMNKTWGIS